jgi:hypothetical protein
MSLHLLKIYKSWGGRDDRSQWSNNYAINIADPPPASGFQDIALAFARMEAIFALTPVNFMRAVISTYVREPVYTPETLRVIELSGAGGRNIPAGATALDLNLSCKFKKNLAYGRSGFMYYRGCLDTSMVSMGAGGRQTMVEGTQVVFNNLAATNAMNEINPALTAAAAEWVVPPSNYIGVPGQVVMENMRIVNGFKFGGITLLKRDHKYFDRANTAIATT